MINAKYFATAASRGRQPERDCELGGEMFYDQAEVHKNIIRFVTNNKFAFYLPCEQLTNTFYIQPALSQPAWIMKVFKGISKLDKFSSHTVTQQIHQNYYPNQIIYQKFTKIIDPIKSTNQVFKYSKFNKSIQEFKEFKYSSIQVYKYISIQIGYLLNC